MIQYKEWPGKLPHAVLLSGEDAIKILYYETGFEQLHPIPPIYSWMEERGFEYQIDWKCVTVTAREEWALCFPNKEICELFLLKWL